MNATPSADQAREPAALFEPFDLTVSLGPGSTPWLSASSCAGFVHGVPRRVALPDLQDLVYDYADAVQFAEPDPNPEIARLLGDLAFGDPMLLQLFLATRSVAADRGRQTLIRILGSPHLAVLPWELLPDPIAQDSGRSHRYLALAPDVHVVRLARGRTYPVRTSYLEPPLNLLIVLSSPTPQNETEDWLAFDIFEVKHNLLAELSPLVRAGLLNIDVEDRPTVENLRRRIGAQRRGYHLFHYVGHAQPDRVIIEDRAGKREDLPIGRLVELLRLCPDLRLALFAGCETARAAGDPSALDTREAVGWRDLLSLSDFCVQEACPAVVGMQAVLPFSTERVFARFFYQGIATGYSVAEALRLARGAVQSDQRVGGDLLDWSVPALFVSGSEPGPLLQRSSNESSPVSRRRIDLKLGLQQRTDRFFARDLPLRQSVDVLGSLTRERVLMVTGASGVGKTALMDRALEELGDDVTHELYLHFERLAPEIVQAVKALEDGAAPDLPAIGQVTDDAVLGRLCRFADEMLRSGGQTPRTRDPAWSTTDWWERLIGDLIQNRLVLAIDEIGQIDRLERELLKILVTSWLMERSDANGSAHAEELLAALQEHDDAAGAATPAASETLTRELRALRDSVAALPRRMLDEATPALRPILEEFVVVSSFPAKARPAPEEPKEPPRPDRALLIAALQALDGVRCGVGRALKMLADRRSSVRIVLTASDMPRGLLELPAAEVFEMRLAPLTWPEMWRWIRRNLPGLVGYGDEYLSRLWPRLGTRLEPWEELERRVLRHGGKGVDLDGLAMEIAPPLPMRPEPTADRAQLRRRGERPLRIAVAGPHLLGPAQLAEAMTRLAIEQGASGRVGFRDGSDAAALATLIDEPSPFEKFGRASLDDILAWLGRVSAKQPDIILLDYGGPAQEGDPAMARQHEFLKILHYRSLLIAAGGNEPRQVTIPAAFPEVLAVGALDDAGHPQAYSGWHAKNRKPDIFMQDNLAGTPLASAIKSEQFHDGNLAGTSMAALHAVAASALVWSIVPELSPRGIRNLLRDAAQPVKGPPGPKALAVSDAVELARRRVIERTLRAGPCSLETLSAITAMDPRVAAETVRRLIQDRLVIRLTSGRLDRLQWYAP